MKTLTLLRYAFAGVAIGAFLVASASTASSLNLAKSAVVPKILVGLQLYTVRDDCAKDFPAVLRAVSAMGFTGVEFAGYYGKSAEELRKLLDEDHLTCYGSHVSWDDLQPDKFDQTVAYNKVLGNKLIVVPWIPTELRNTKAALIATAKKFDDIAKKLDREGIMLGYHNHMDEFREVEGELPWYTFFGNTDRLVKIQFDTGNAMEAGAQAAPFLQKYPSRVVSIHVKDFSKTNPKALLGEGDENWNEVIPILKHKIHPRWFIIEQETYPLPPLECAAKCLQTFKKMWAEK